MLDLDMTKITIDGIEYDVSNASDAVNDQLTNLNFVNDLILQKNNELQVAETAKMGYSRALKRELEKLDLTMTNKIKIGSVEYDLDEMSDNCKNLVGQLRGMDIIIQEKSNLSAVLTRAKKAYIEDLKSEMIAKAGFDFSD